MQLCRTCGQALAESVKTCPNCGSETPERLERVDEYQILEIAHEGHASILCRAITEGDEVPVALRLFTVDSGVDDAVAQRLTQELEELQKLPEEWFVQHLSIRRSSEGRWYRVSEWIEAEGWGSLLSSGRLQSVDVAYDLFYRLAAILAGLHQSGHFIPHLTLNDILVLKGEPGRVDVKVDYKLSRFLDPQLAQPRPMLQRLLDCHPDIVGGRPLDFKTDIWSLARIFVQILSGDLEICDPRPLLQDDTIPSEMATLLRSMLADDPALRPDSMQEVAETLRRIQKESVAGEPDPSTDTAREIRKLRKTVTVLGAFFVVLIALVGGFFYWYDRTPADSESALEDYANRYAGSVAFVMVQYQIQVDDTVLYRERREGTAFLVDSDGYLLTNRHVACPWLEDEAVFKLIHHIEQAGKIPLFEYQIFLWFEGDTAFNRLVGIGPSDDIEDIYDLASAFSRGGDPGASIAGVARLPLETGKMVRAPLRDDYAVLQISRVPPGLLPLPLDREFKSSSLKRLSPVIALGFPLGSTTQADVINVSVTRGHIRRTFENFFQVDTSIYKGNSGGPIIDKRGKVIGIASAVATDVAVAPLPVITPLSDIGLVLPVTDAARFIDELKEGRPKWNGVLDLSAASKIRTITETALAGRWAEAQRLADQGLEDSDAPSLIMAAAMMHYCNGDMAGAADLFDRLLSIDAENYQARLMRYLTGLDVPARRDSAHLGHLMSLDWRSQGEFYGHLARILQTAEIDTSLLGSWNTVGEKSWIYYIAGLVARTSGDWSRARELFMGAAQAAGDDDWPLYLSLAECSRDPGCKKDRLATFMQDREQQTADRVAQQAQLALMLSEFENKHADPADRLDILLRAIKLDSEDKRLGALASYYGMMASRWPEALAEADRFLKMDGREEPLRLGTGLLAPVISEHMGDDEGARARLLAYCDRTQTSWYRQVCETLLDRRPEEDLVEKAGVVPEKILTGYTALGFRAEALGDDRFALKYYREALGSYLDNWIEYELARQRYIALRQGEKD